MSDPAPALPSPPAESLLRSSLRIGLAWYLGSSAVVVLTVLYCWTYLLPPGREWWQNFAVFDAVPYTAICANGYDYDPVQPTILGYLPGFPLLAWPLTLLPGVWPELALLLTAHICLAAAFVALAAYVRLRFPAGGTPLQHAVLAALGFLPVTFAFRMALTEAPFLLLVLLVFLGMERQWPAGLLALLIGFATLVRPVGIALIPPFWLYLWQQAADRRVFALRAALWTPVCLWGLIGFVAYCGLAFGEPLAYSRIQRQLVARAVGLPTENRLLALLTLKPFWNNFVPDADSRCYWGNLVPEQEPWLCLLLANPVWFGLTIVVIVVGALRGMINRAEMLLAAGLLAIPYATIALDLCMCSHSRYAAVVFPLYLVVGQWLVRLPVMVTFLLALPSAVLLMIYASRFVLVYAASY